MIELELLAERRHRAWKRLSDRTLSPAERHSTALQVRRLTSLLNGHDSDCWRDVLTTTHFQRPLDGLWAERRKSRL